MTDPVPPSVRAQLLATEHWSLLATRSQTWSEVMSRITAQFTFTSAVLVVLALVVQYQGTDGDFRPLALGLGAAVLLTGTMTAMRVHYASHEDFQLVRGMNRLRHAYVEMDPTIARYLVSGHTDDGPGLTQTYTMGPERDATQAIASASVFIVVVNALVAGGWVGMPGQPGRNRDQRSSWASWPASPTSCRSSTPASGCSRSTRPLLEGSGSRPKVPHRVLTR